LQDYIFNSKNQLTHIIVDDDPKLPEFLRDINKNEDNYKYLKKVFDSKNDGFKHQMKIFEIDFKLFNYTYNK